MSIPILTPRQLHQPEVHGHRGCRGLRPENTMSAFLHAVALGVEVIELDVVISQDHQVVVSHEPWLSAKLGRGPQGELIEQIQEQRYNLYQLPYTVIRQCSVGEWSHANFPEQQPELTHRPLLREVLHQVTIASQQHGRAVGFSVEIKAWPMGDDIFHPRPALFVDLVVAELLAADTLSRTTLLSFDTRVLQAARRAYPSLALCLLIEDYLPAITTIFNDLGFEPESLGPDFHLLSASSVQHIRTTYPTLRLVPWTVNTPAELTMALGWQPDAITTDYPDRLIALLNKGE
ncbi:glycerophosphodiester phosphodiesterase family protein [Hymenobacter sp. BT559]|uniref:glycerophosphodiester phosphodiesterase family protein n=1 Tax=Hymenobacter sp. BT559 TaxID=2795729 RepID=UPI0018EC2D49|nr:glycerophosphodiester phosphodiesterase family protein [Hymenobacter sp. BT559]MBJ6144025.1 glycerophosphodiester phosphodiesterase [Hymenobacter sp. BT559]